MVVNFTGLMNPSGPGPAEGIAPLLLFMRLLPPRVYPAENMVSQASLCERLDRVDL